MALFFFFLFPSGFFSWLLVLPYQTRLHSYYSFPLLLSFFPPSPHTLSTLFPPSFPYRPPLMTTRKSPSSVPVTDTLLALLRPAKRLSYHDAASVTSLDFDNLGQYLVSAGVDKSIQLYDCYKGVRHKDVQSQKYGAHLARFTHTDLGCLYASTPSAAGDDHDHSVRHLLLSTKAYLRYFKGHKDQVLALEMNPVSDTFVSASADHTVKTWDLRTSSASGSLAAGHASAVAFDTHGIVLALAKHPRTVSFYDVANMERGPFLETPLGVAGDERWTSLEFSNNGKYVLVGTDSPRHYVLDALLGKHLATLVVDTHAPDHWLRFAYASLPLACFTPDGRFVLAGTPTGAVALFDLLPLKTESRGSVLTFHPYKVIQGGQGATKVLAFNPKLLALATSDNAVVLWLAEADV